MSELAFMTATELLALMRAGELSSRDLLELHLDRIERFNPDINAVVTIEADNARAAADRADRARADGEELGPLHGLPMTVKDCFETAGMRTTCGAPFLAGHVPAEDAVAVARLRGAGAIVFGKTNLPFLAADGQSYNDVHGQTNNPWDLARVPGGSSGGAAAALAAGLTPLEIGSDISGSVRHPAHFAGVFGHKPTYGLIPLRGHIMPPPGFVAPTDVNVIGPLARGADDLELALDVLAGPDAAAAVAWRLTIPPARRRAVGEYRVAAWLDDPSCRVDREVLAGLRRAADALAAAGATVDERPGPVDLADAIRVHRMLLMGVACSGPSDDDFAAMRRAAAALPDDDRSDAANHLRWKTATKRDWNAVDEERHRMRAAWARFFEDYDALLCPSVPCSAIPHDHSEPSEARVITINGEERPYWDQVCWLSMASAAGLPATAVPVGLTASGLPVGGQVVGPYLEDRTAIDVARHLAAATGGFQAPPAFAATGTAAG